MPAPMRARNKQSNSLIVEDRRREVAILRRRRLTLRQIVQALDAAGRRNPRTNAPWGLTVIHGDIKALEEQARADAMRETIEHKAENLASLKELERIAWEERRYEDVRKVLKDQRDLLGLDAPQVIIHEQVTAQMMQALDALEDEFRDEPGIYERITQALMGAGGHGSSRALN